MKQHGKHFVSLSLLMAFASSWISPVFAATTTPHHPTFRQEIRHVSHKRVTKRAGVGAAVGAGAGVAVGAALLPAAAVGAAGGVGYHYAKKHHVGQRLKNSLH